MSNVLALRTAAKCPTFLVIRDNYAILRFVLPPRVSECHTHIILSMVWSVCNQVDLQVMLHSGAFIALVNGGRRNQLHYPETMLESSLYMPILHSMLGMWRGAIWTCGGSLEAKLKCRLIPKCVQLVRVYCCSISQGHTSFRVSMLICGQSISAQYKNARREMCPLCKGTCTFSKLKAHHPILLWMPSYEIGRLLYKYT